MLLCTLKSTVAFFSLFFIVDISLLLTGIGYFHRDQNGEPNSQLVQAGGFFAILTAFLAWYNAYAGVADSSNTWLVVPVVHFPWSEKARHARRDRREYDTAAWTFAGFAGGEPLWRWRPRFRCNDWVERISFVGSRKWPIETTASERSTDSCPLICLFSCIFLKKEGSTICRNNKALSFLASIQVYFSSFFLATVSPFNDG